MRTEPTAVFKALADPTRRAIFERLSRDGDQTVPMLVGGLERIVAGLQLRH